MSSATGFGEDAYASTPFGGASTFQVAGASSLSLNIVQVVFSEDVDNTAGSTLDIANYSIPGLTITSVALDPSDTSAVLLTTSVQEYLPYTVTVTGTYSLYGDSIDLTANTALFTGYASAVSFVANGISRTRVLVLFSVLGGMLNNSAFTTPSNYTLTDVLGNIIPVASVTASGPVGETSAATLTLGSTLTPGKFYVLTLNSAVQSLGGLSIVPNTSTFIYVEQALNVTVPTSIFTGEVQGGLYGTSAGMVYFSPSLATGASPNSSIQVDDVSVCTTAYDSYSFPGIVDPPVLFTYALPTFVSVPTTLNNSSLFAVPNRLGEFKYNLSDKHSESVAAATESHAIATLVEPMDPTYVSLLNNTYWHTYDGTGHAFITANNLAPVPAGTTTPRTLET